jgi:hypothetical protein
MANANRRFGFLNFAIFATGAAVAAALAVGALAYQPDLDGGSIALSTGSATSAPEALLERYADKRAANPLATFLQRWTNTAVGEQ